MNRKIGGEFDLNLSFSKENNFQYFDSGRSAFRRILKDLKKNDILQIQIPEYLCNSIIDSINKENLSYNFYSLNEKLHVNYSSLIEHNKNTAVLLINFFGLQKLKEDVEEIQKRKIPVIVDNSQNFFNTDNFIPDYSFNSFRKFLPVPEGAEAFCKNNRISAPQTESDFGLVKICGGITKNLHEKYLINENLYLNLFKKGEEILDNQNNIRSISAFSGMLLKTLDFNKLKDIRRNNYIYAKSLLKKSGLRALIDDLPDNNLPLAIPVMLKNRDLVRKKLFDNSIFLPVHWPDQVTEKGSKISKDELSIIIDHRLNKNDIKFIFEKIIEYGGG